MERIARLRVADRVTVQRFAVVMVGLHFLTGVSHGLTHELFDVSLLWWQALIVVLAVLLGPLVGALLVWRDRLLLGGWVLFVTLTVAFVFELLAHFVISHPGNPDYIGAVGAGQTAFAGTAAAAVLTDLLGIVAGICCLLAARNETQ